jgi:hypothetical protein
MIYNVIAALYLHKITCITVENAAPTVIIMHHNKQVDRNRRNNDMLLEILSTKHIDAFQTDIYFQNAAAWDRHFR